MLCIPDTFCRDLRISDVPATTGIDRDEAVINLPVPTTSNVIEYLTQVTSLIKVDWRSLLVGVAPELPNTTEGTLTLASTFGIAGILKCLDQHSRNLPQNTEPFLPTTDSNSTTPRVLENTSAPTATLPRLHLDRSETWIRSTTNVMLANSSTFSTSPVEVFQIIRLIVMTVLF